MRFRERFIRQVERGLLAAEVAPARPLLVALSSGPDSTALLLACCALRERRGFEVRAAHFNHRLRGAESDGDARFAEQLCRELSVACVMGEADVAAHRARKGMSLEEAARELRYRFLALAACEHGAQAVATGHTLDDQAETVLLHLVRGSGLAGLAGMPPLHVRAATAGAPAVRVVRPLLGLRRADAARFCAEHGVEPRLDSSNEDLRYARNRLRHVVLPQMAAVNPRVVEAIARLSSHVRAALDLVAGQVDAAWRETAVEGDAAVRLSRDRMLTLPEGLQHHLLRRLHEQVTGSTAHLELAHVEQMASAVSKGAGASANLPGGLRLEVGYDCVTLVREDAGGDAACPYPPAVPDAPLRVPATVPLGGGFAVSAAVGAAPAAFEDSSRWVGHLDPSLARTALRVRSRRPGDRFQPLGMTAPKRLQDFLVDERVPRAWRDRVPLVESDRGIAWIAGCRPAEWARVPEGARRALRLELVGPV